MFHPPSLKNQELLPDRCPVAGQGINADNRATIVVTHHSAGEPIAQVPSMERRGNRRAIGFAETAGAAWRSKTAKERAIVLRRWFDLMMQNQEDLAAIMTAEQASRSRKAAARSPTPRASSSGSANKANASTAIPSRPSQATSASWFSSSRSACAQRSRPGTSRRP
jgi:acyl-CoA reductase-like NAD-dependent aldehyde dehydrogenase